MRVPFALLALLFPVLCFSQKEKIQKSNLKFGDIKAEDFEPKYYDVDSSASAVVLADIGETKFEGNNDGFFSIIFKHHKRIRIMNKNGYDAASIEIPIYRNSRDEEKLDDFEACTYNIENGKVVVTKVDKASIFKDKFNKNYSVRKFTFPNLKEGSILEVKYTIINPFFRLRDWDFQGSMPRLWSEYSVSVPSMFDYVVLKQGYREFEISDAEVTNGLYSILVPGSVTDRSEVVNWQGPVYHNVWAVKDAPALKDEPYTTTLDNHIQKVEFQLRSIRYPNGRVENVMGSWTELAANLMKDEQFGAELQKSNNFFDDELKKVIAGANGDRDMARRIYMYVRDNYSCTDHSGIWMSNTLKKTFQSKKGNVADINLMLTAMLRSQGFIAKPVILSTTDHGKIYELYPLTGRFNYVITQVKIGEENVLLDASDSKMGFGRLPQELYNGYARVVDLPIPALIDNLFADSLKESKVTSVFILNSEDGQTMTGSFTSNLGYMESYDLRERLGKITTEDFFKEIRKEYNFDVEIENTSLDSAKLYDHPIAVKYDFKFNTGDDIIYLNPILAGTWKDNPFASTTREYPVEMGHAFNETYVLNMEIPKGYKVEELPKSTRVRLNEDEGMFEYIINATATNIQFRCKLSINKANFEKADYQTLRDFFAMVVKKESEQIVLKKID
ncbi:MAG TPA: DUF3857 domain-containing protein [Chitinophagaceae bacterium]